MPHNFLSNIQKNELRMNFFPIMESSLNPQSIPHLTGLSNFYILHYISRCNICTRKYESSEILWFEVSADRELTELPTNKKKSHSKLILLELRKGRYCVAKLSAWIYRNVHFNRHFIDSPQNEQPIDHNRTVFQRNNSKKYFYSQSEYVPWNQRWYAKQNTVRLYYVLRASNSSGVR